MTIQDFHKNSEWLQGSGNSEKPENDTKIEILKFQENCHKPSLLQGLERFFKVTPCNEKCNFFILLQNIPLLRILLMSIIPLCRDRTSLLVQLQNLLFCMRGFLSPILHFLFFCRLGFRSPILTFLMKSNLSNQWIRRIEKDTKFVTVTNSCDIKKVALNPV